MNHTDNYNLGLPLTTEKYDVNVFNTNYTIIDAALKNNSDIGVLHVNDKNNPHEVTAAQVGLGNVDNTADLSKPVSNPQAQAIATAVGNEETRAKAAEQANADAIAAIQASMPGIATTSTVGLVKPDGTTITIQNDGTISATQAPIDSALSTTSTNAVQNKVVTTALNSKADQATTYTKTEVDNKLSQFETKIDWKEAVATYNDIATTYPNPEDGWTVNVKDTDYTYRYNGSSWIAISANAIPVATTSVNGLMSSTMVAKLNGIEEGAQVNTITGVKGDAESTYRTGDVNITKANIGLGNVENVSVNDAAPTFTQASTRVNIASGESLSTLFGKIKKFFADLKTVAFSGSYNDLSNKPTIGDATLTIQRNGTTVKTFTANATSDVSANITVPTKTSDLTNDSGFITSSALPTVNDATLTIQKNGTDVQTFTANQDTNVTANITVPTKTSDLNNDSGFITASSLPTVNNATLTIQKNGTAVKTFTANASADVTANITVPTKTSELTNDSGFITSSSLPTVNNATLTIQKNGTSVKTFTANAASDVTCNITVPTKTSDLTNDSGYTTNAGTVTSVATGTGLTGGPITSTGTISLASGVVTEGSAGPTANVTGTEGTTIAIPRITVDTYGRVTGLTSYTLTNKNSTYTVNNGTLTIQKNGTNVQTFTANQSSNATANITVPTKTSELTNDSGFITSSSVGVTSVATGNGLKGGTITSTGTISTNVPRVAKDSKSLPGANSWVLEEFTSGTNYNLPSNHWYYIFSMQGSDTAYGAQLALGMTTAAAYYRVYNASTWGSWQSIINTVPTVNNGTLTIQKNGTNVQTFTANQSSSVTANITVPTKVSELTNDSGYTTNTGTVTSVKVGSTSYSPSSGVVSLPAYPTDTNTHRPIQLKGTEILGNNTTALNFAQGSNVTLSNSGGTITIAATDTWRPVVNNLTSDSTDNSLSAAQGKALANGSARDSTKVPLSGGTMTGNLSFKSTVIDASKADNGVSSTQYPTTFNILDNSDRILTRKEAIVESNGNISAFWYARNYNTSGTLVAQKGIKLTINKSGTMTYTVDDPANFRSAIGAGTSSFSGNYNDLTNKPTIPTVNNATLKIQKNGTDVKTFTANASSDVTCNITVPTKVSELTNDSGYTTNTGTVTSVKVGSTSYSPSSGVVSLPAYPTVNNATLTIQRNGSSVQTFTANQSSNATANIIVDSWTSTATVSSSNTVAFSGLDDSYGYDLYCENKLLSITSVAKSGSGTSTTLTYTVTGASTGDVCKLRILK